MAHQMTPICRDHIFDFDIRVFDYLAPFYRLTSAQRRDIKIYSNLYNLPMSNYCCPTLGTVCVKLWLHVQFLVARIAHVTIAYLIQGKYTVEHRTLARTPLTKPTN